MAENYSGGGQRGNDQTKDITLEEISENVKTSSLRNSRNAASSSIKAMMMADELDMDIDISERPKLYEMSEKYGNSRKRTQEILKKDTLDRSEKEYLKNNMRENIYAVPKGIDRKKSIEMSETLREELRAKEAAKGFRTVLILAGLGLLSAALTRFSGIGNGISQFMAYLPIVSAAFSLFMLIRSKAVRLISLVYFIISGIALLGPGIIASAADPDTRGGSGFVSSAMLMCAALICIVTICYCLAKNKSVRNYYFYSPGKRRK